MSASGEMFGGVFCEGITAAGERGLGGSKMYSLNSCPHRSLKILAYVWSMNLKYQISGIIFASYLCELKGNFLETR